MIAFKIFGILITIEEVLCTILFLGLMWTKFRGKDKDISCFHPASLVATCFGIGRIPFASGTWGTIFGVFLIIEIVFLPRRGIIQQHTLMPILFGLTSVICLLGLWASKIYIEKTGKKDPKEVVIDEVAGIFTAVALSAAIYAGLLFYDEKQFVYLLVFTPVYLLLLFLLFRLFDIWKPWIIGKIDKDMVGATGVMLDDVVAGIFASLVFYTIFLSLYFSGGFIKIFSTFFPDWIGTVGD